MSNRQTWVESVHSVRYDVLPGKPGKPECLVAVYRTDRGEIREYVSVQGDGFARVRAEMWWAAHVDGCWLPDTSQEALKSIFFAMNGLYYRLRRPTQILVEKLETQRFPNVASWRFDGEGK